MAGKRRIKNKESIEPSVNLYTTFNKWIFDGDLNTPIPHPELMLKYNSPINHIFLIRMFINNAKGNYFLNETFNNMGLRYLDIEEFFYFIKKCVKDFRLSKNQIPYFKWKSSTKIYNSLKMKYPLLKSYEVELLAELIEDHDDRDSYYSGLGVDIQKKTKAKKIKNVTRLEAKKSVIALYLEANFKMVEVEN